MAPGYSGDFSHDDLKNPSSSKIQNYAPGVESDDPKGDQRLSEVISEKIYAHPELKNAKVELYVRNGYVSLNGEVDTTDQKSTIEAMVSNISGVIDVVNFLKLRPAFESGSGDGLHNGIPNH